MRKPETFRHTTPTEPDLGGQLGPSPTWAVASRRPRCGGEPVAVIESLRLRIPIHVVCLLLPALLSAADRGKVTDGFERLLYVADRSGVSVYDINDSHRPLRKIE